jgi:hypothetical protein
MATKQIRVEYQLALPNEFLVDHEITDGNTRTAVYNGPDKIYLQIGADGTEKHGPLTEDDIMDGRPMPADVVEWFEVDCTTNPLVCELRGQPVDELQEEYTSEEFHAKTPEIEGYPRLKYALPLMPSDIYDKSKLTVDLDSGEIDVPRFTVSEKLLDRAEFLTWDQIREKRDSMLEATDMKVSVDMPSALVDEWKVYRQKLRDFPATMQASGVEPSWAYYMMPQSPDDLKAPKNGESL